MDGTRRVTIIEEWRGERRATFRVHDARTRDLLGYLFRVKGLRSDSFYGARNLDVPRKFLGRDLLIDDAAGRMLEL